MRRRILFRAALVALAPVLLHALAREADRGLGLVLRAEVEPEGLLAEVGRAMGAEAAGAAVRVALWVVAGIALWLGLAVWRRWREGTAWADALAGEAVVFTVLLLRPAMTIVALLSVATRASYPYGFTLPVALTQDWAIAQDVAVLAALVAWRLPDLRVPAPRAGEVFALAFLAYALLVPDWAWRWEGHPGNEPKYLRQAVALGHGLTFDAEGVSAAMEDLPTRPLSESVVAAAGTLGRESWSMALALAHGDVGRQSIRAARITRQTIRGKEGGVFYVLAPGPSLMLAPALRVDRAINLSRGRPGRVAVSVLEWCALAALLVMALFQLVRDATGRAGLAAALAFGFALVPPFLFYSFQFYPEMVGALVMAAAFRTLALRPEGLRQHPWLFGGMLAALPWLHQKFLPVWLALVATALFVGLSSRGASIVSGDEGLGRTASLGMTRWAVGLVVPTLVGLYLTALYNFAITGSVRPDALFLAWGPGGVTSARVGQGVFGLLLDARYGILPYVPILLLAAGGLASGGARRFAVVMPAAAAYYLTVASADNWAGAVCNLGRYFMPVASLAVALVGIAIDRVLPRSVSSRGTWFEPGPEAKPRVSFLPVGRGESAGAEIADPSSPGEPRLVGMTSEKAELVGMTSEDAELVGMTGEEAEVVGMTSEKAELVGMTSEKAELVGMTGGGATRGALALVLMLAAWTALLAVALWWDPHAANDSAVLLAKSTYADGNQYVPNLFIRAWGDAAPGLWARVAVWLAGLGAVAGWLARLERAAIHRPPGHGPRGDSPLATLATVGALVLVAGLFLERWPGKRDAPSFADRLPAPGVTPPALSSPNAPAVFVSGAAWVREEEAILGPGPVELLVRAPLPASSLRVTVGGPEGVLQAIGLPPLVLRPRGGLYDLPLIPYHEVRGRDGRRVAFSRTSLALDGQAVLRLGSLPAHGPRSEPPVEPDGEMEPQPGGAR